MKPAYTTALGTAFCGDSLDVMSELSPGTVNLVVTSPPFPLTFRKKKPYNHVGENDFVAWMCKYAAACHRLLSEDGSMVLDLGGVWNKGSATKSLYQHRLLLALCDDLGFHFAQDFYWYNPAALPAPAEWVNVRRVRVKSAVNLVYWLSKSETPKANNRNVLRQYSRDMLRLIERGYRAKERPSGHAITGKFQKDQGGSIPPNLLEIGNNDSNSEYIKGCGLADLPVHPARFPRALPEFFIKLAPTRKTWYWIHSLVPISLEKPQSDSGADGSRSNWLKSTSTDLACDSVKLSLQGDARELRSQSLSWLNRGSQRARRVGSHIHPTSDGASADLERGAGGVSFKRYQAWACSSSPLDRRLANGRVLRLAGQARANRDSTS